MALDIEVVNQFAAHAEHGTYSRIDHATACNAYLCFRQQLSYPQFRAAMQQFYEQAAAAYRAVLAGIFQRAIQVSGDVRARKWVQMDPQRISGLQLTHMHQHMDAAHPDLMHEILELDDVPGSPGFTLAAAGIAAFAARYLSYQASNFHTGRAI